MVLQQQQIDCACPVLARFFSRAGNYPSLFVQTVCNCCSHEGILFYFRTNFYLPSSCHLLDVIPLCCLFAILLNSARGVQHTILEYLRKTTRTVTTTNASQSTTPPQTKIMSKIQTIGTSTKINHVDTSTICWDQKNLRKASTPFHKKLLKSSKEGGL